MKIYIADIRALAGERVLLEKYELLSKERRERVQSFRRPADQQRCVGAGLLLEYGLQQRGFTLHENMPGKRPVHVAKGQYGKPYLVDTENLFFNLSHSGNYAAAGFAECELGIDVEQVRTVNPAVARRFFTKEENTYLDLSDSKDRGSERHDTAFYEVWTRKESYIKAVGEGMHLSLTDFCVLSDRVGENGEYGLKTWVLSDELILSACAKGEVDAAITWIDLKKLDWQHY